MSKYIGADEYVSQEIIGSTPLGTPIYKVTLASGKAINLTQRMLDNSFTDEPTDLTVLQDQRGKQFVTEALALVDEWGISDDDYSRWMNWLGDAVNIKRDRAISKAFGVDGVEDWSIANYQLILNEQTNTDSSGTPAKSEG